MKKRIFSGVQPSGNLHIGNYLGAIKNWVSLQDTHDNIFCVVDLHAITVPQDPKELKKRIYEITNIYLASGIDPKKSSIFVQSARPEHSELAWILNCFAYMGEMKRMTQFKEKSGLSQKEKWTFDKISKKLNEKLISDFTKDYKNISPKTIKEIILRKGIQLSLKNVWKIFIEKELRTTEEKTSVGLFDYPVLMAADILLYNTNLVPVGKDQYQHIEMTRTIAKRFNNKYGNIFTVPEPFSTRESIMIMGLDDPTKKMAKSAKSDNNYIALRDSEDQVRKKISRAVTDTGKEIKFDMAEKPGISNLMNIYSSFSGKNIQEIEKKYKNKTYKEFKDATSEIIIGFLKPFQKKLAELEKDPQYTEKVLKEGSEKVAPLAKENLEKIKKAIGLGL